jgi:hypothetical protein
LLRERGVKGDDVKLETAVEAFGGHAYALQLLGRYLEFFGSSEIAATNDIPAGTEFSEESRHPQRVMAAFAGKFGEGSAEVELLRVLGLFDRPAERGAIAAVRAAPIPDLTERLVNLDEGAWQGLLRRLRATGLIAPASGHAPDEVDAHPLVREHFGEELLEKHPEAWRAGHGRLYEHFKGLPEKHQPDTLEEMGPLFQAVFHGCQAGRHQEAFDEVYFARIQRSVATNYCMDRLGAVGADLGALAGFFDPPWEQPVGSITGADLVFVESAAGFRLRALGRLQEAAPPMQAAADRSVSDEHWKRAATCATNLSELKLTLGEVGEAIALGEQSVNYAERSGDAFWRVASLTTLADALDQAGERARGRTLSRGGAPAGGVAARLSATIFIFGLSILRSAARSGARRRGARQGAADA